MPTILVKPKRNLGNRIAIVAGVIVLHMGLIYGFLSWKGHGHPLPLLINVKIIPAGHAQGPLQPQARAKASP